MNRSTPVFNSRKAAHTFKFPGVISHNNQSPTAGMTRDYLIKMARQGVPDGQVLLLSGRCVWQQQRRNPERQCGKQIPRSQRDYVQASGFFSAPYISSIRVTVLMHIFLVQVKTFPDTGGFVLYRKNADVGIEHKLQHQNDSLSCIPGCSLLSIKSALTWFPSNHSSHVSPAGVMIRVRPTAIIFNAFYVFRQCNRFWQSDRLAAVAEKYGGFHYLLSMWICLVYIHCGIDAGICQRDIRL